MPQAWQSRTAKRDATPGTPKEPAGGFCRDQRCIPAIGIWHVFFVSVKLEDKKSS